MRRRVVGDAIRGIVITGTRIGRIQAASGRMQAMSKLYFPAVRLLAAPTGGGSSSRTSTVETMDLLRVLILAFVQGLTEFLPISSDGHLLVASALFEAAGGAPL